MSDSVLAHVALACQPVWGAHRAMVAMVLDIHPLSDIGLDGSHFMAALEEFRSDQTPQLLLRTSSPALLTDLLLHAPVSPSWLVLDAAALVEPDMAVTMQLAHARGLHLVWRGSADQQMAQDHPTEGFATDMVTLGAAQNLAIHARLSQPEDRSPSARLPRLAGRLCEGVASARVAGFCLDQAHAAGIVGWPIEEAAHHGPGPVPPDEAILRALVRDIDKDASMDALEERLGSDPVLAYRFLRYVNSAGLGLRAEVESLRHGLMMVGAGNLRHWLATMLPHASKDPNFGPLRHASVLRARLMEQLVDAGTEHELRGELHLCGLFADLDLLAGEPWAQLLHHMPLSGRIIDAMVGKAGPYAPYLALARAMEEPGATQMAPLCEELGVSLDDANRALLRMLASALAS